MAIPMDNGIIASPSGVDFGNEVVNEWKGIKKNNARIRKRRQIRKRVEMLVKVKK